MSKRKLLTQNRELRPLGIHNWTLPAWVVRTTDGRNVNVCEQAGACVKLCYARQGAYRFPGVAAAHERNLRMVLDDLSAWTVVRRRQAGRRNYLSGSRVWLLRAFLNTVSPQHGGRRDLPRHPVF